MLLQVFFGILIESKYLEGWCGFYNGKSLRYLYLRICYFTGIHFHEFWLYIGAHLTYQGHLANRLISPFQCQAVNVHAIYDATVTIMNLVVGQYPCLKIRFYRRSWHFSLQQIAVMTKYFFRFPRLCKGSFYFILGDGVLRQVSLHIFVVWELLPAF